MSSAPALQQSKLKQTITVQNGPDKGVAYLLLPPKATIGRGEGNDIALSDLRCSRTQAVIHLTEQRVFVEDVSARQTTYVNGRHAPKQDLKDGDIIQIGDTEMRFSAEAASPAPILTAVPPFVSGETATLAVVENASTDFATVPLKSVPTYQTGPQERVRSTTPPSDTKAGNRIAFYGIIAVVGVVFYFLVNATTATTQKLSLRSAEEIEKEIKTTDARADEIAKVKEFATEEDRSRSEEAQKHYLIGFRDYQKGQYGRALRSFETARAINPEHELANRYSVLAERKRDESITLNMVEGRRYKEKHMFARCSSALEKVLDEIGNDQDIRFKESIALKRECDLMMKRTY